MIHSLFALLRRLPPFLLTVIVELTILYLTLWPDPLPDSDIKLFPHADKVIHFLMFGGLAGMTCLDTAVWRRGNISQLTIVVIAIMSALMGGIIELLQDWMGYGRSAEWLDLIADSAGAFTGAAVAYFLIRKEGSDASQSQS